ncbi:MAG: glucose-1-phosphate adenylyltransferase [Nitrospirae bacterium]|nr:glucose-1-phosphate adenylyltransferase [Nitrospirota bacterium]
MAQPKVLAMVLAGGRGKRLFPLTFERSKPAVPFGGRNCIVDFVLSNFINSHIFSIYLLVQYKSQSIIDYVRENWGLSSVMHDHFVTVVPPQMRFGPDWFQGTADAVFQNLNLIRHHKPELVAVFGADHIYRMDIRKMIDFHLKNDADVTVATRPIHLSEGSSFGIIVADVDGRIKGFEEKPDNPTPMPTDPERAYCSMGNYIFKADILFSALADAQRKKEHDFGGYVIPSLVGNKRVFAYDFASSEVAGIQPHEEKGYWRDVGTIKSYWDAHQDILGDKPLFEMNNELWPVRPSRNDMPATKILRAEIVNSLIAEGSIINNAKITNCVIRRGVVIENGVEIKDSIIMDRVVLRKGCRVNRTIVDCYNVIEDNVQLGEGSDKPYLRAYQDPSGITVIASERQSLQI